ncbi:MULTISPECIES: hypothetical protein [Acinetobacter]|uniref:Uncharacterized protein n=1 Tax=Acinetobacter higginsii TaxID=70347 RepID=N9TER9_9GAMM|nr:MULTISPECIES: hypothetical protein [Acinetobacter]ENX62047.1 hypothetical protein F902_00236 [Acinetobacter higginsii]MCH7296463.1 hypothetical protein [Acinetobacter higginsii]
MKIIGLGLLNYLLLLLIVLVVAYSHNFNIILDIFFAQFSSILVTLFISTLGIIKGLKTYQATLILLITQITSLLSWLAAMIFLSYFEISLYSTTALLFDLILGVITAITICFFMLEKFLNIDEKMKKIQ